MKKKNGVSIKTAIQRFKEWCIGKDDIIIEETSTKFNAKEVPMDKIWNDKQQQYLDGEFSKVHKRMDSMEKRIEGVEEGVKENRRAIHSLEKKVDQIIESLQKINNILINGDS